MPTLKLSDNSKTKFRRDHKNTFGLTYGLPSNGGTCPGATEGKGGCLDVRDGHKRPTCYMAKVTQIYKAVGAVLTHNTDLLMGKTQVEMAGVLRETMEAFVKANEAKKDALFFRLHYSGDFFSEDYARAWAEVMVQFPQVRFWVYSRSYSYAGFFAQVPNLTFFFSVDPVNYASVLEHYRTVSHLPNFALAWLGSVPAPQQAEHRWVTCPETSGKLPNLPDSGACSRCRLCVDNFRVKVKNIQFVLH